MASAWTPLVSNLQVGQPYAGFMVLTLAACLAQINSAGRPTAQFRWQGAATMYYVLEANTADAWLPTGDVACPVGFDQTKVYVLFVANDPNYSIPVPASAFTWIGDDKGSGDSNDVAFFFINNRAGYQGNTNNVATVMGDVVADYGATPVNPNNMYANRLIGAVLNQFVVNIALSNNPPGSYNPANAPYFIGSSNTDNLGHSHNFVWMSRTSPYANFATCSDPPSPQCNNWAYFDVILPAQVGKCCGLNGTVPFTLLQTTAGMVTQAGNTVTGLQTAFTATMVNGILEVPGVTVGVVTAVSSPTSLTLSNSATFSTPAAYLLSYSVAGSTNCGAYGLPAVSGQLSQCQIWATTLASQNIQDPNVQSFLTANPGKFDDLIVNQICNQPANQSSPSARVSFRKRSTPRCP